MRNFYELIQTACDTTRCLSKTPNDSEWGSLFEDAEKQSMVGVCFAGVVKLADQYQRPPMELLMDWLGQAEYIRTRNAEIDEQCKTTYDKLTAAEFECVILKGQGVGLNYKTCDGRNLSDLRTPGDIDVWILPKKGESFNELFNRVMEYAKSISDIKDFNRQHVSISFIQGTEVEVHFTPSLMCCPSYNKRLQEWFRSYDYKNFSVCESFFCIPDRNSMSYTFCNTAIIISCLKELACVK